MKKSINILDVFLAFVVSLGTVFSNSYFNTGSPQTSLHKICLAVVITVTLLVSLYLIENYLQHDEANKTSLNNRWQGFWHRLLKQDHLVLVSALVIFLIWLIPLIFLYPGSLSNDGWNQLGQFKRAFAGGHIHQNIISDHHPFVDTLIMGIVVTPFGHFHHWQGGLFAYVLIQAALTAFAFTWTIWFAKERLGLAERVQRRLLLTYSIWPVFATTVGSISKDTLFSWIYVLFMIIYADIILSKGNDLRERSLLWSLVIVGVGCILTKKLGIYIIAISLIMLCLLVKNNRKRMIALSIVVLLVAEGILHVGSSVLGTVPGGKQEMFSLPFQQTARCLKDHPHSLKGHDRKVVNAVLPVKGIAKRYNPNNADPVKGYKDRGTGSQYVSYIKVWLKMGIHYPKSYVNATNSMLAGWFSTYEYQPLMNMANHTQLDGQKMIDQATASRHGWAKKTSSFIESFYNDLYGFPLFTLFLSYAFYASILPLIIVCLVLKDSVKRNYALLVPMILSIVLGCWLSPVSAQTTEGMRYLIPVIYTLPLMMVIVKYLWQKYRTQQK